jgi:hypothetical protein
MGFGYTVFVLATALEGYSVSGLFEVSDSESEAKLHAVRRKANGKTPTGWPQVSW